jgi:hypothetical protein
LEASDEAHRDIRNRLPENGFTTVETHRRRLQPLRSPGKMTTIAAIALTAGLTALAALAVFVYFGAYWRMVWRQNRRGEATTLRQTINIDTVRTPDDLARNHSPRSRIRI